VDASQRRYTVPEGVRQLSIHVSDTSNEDLKQHFSRSNAFIQQALDARA